MARNDQYGKGFPVDQTSERKIGQSLFFGKDVDDKIIPITADKFSGALVGIDAEHHKVHEGKGYHLSHYLASLAAETPYNILLKNPAANYPHLRSYHAVGTGGPLHIQLFEGTTVSADGTSLSSHNMNRNSVNISTLAAFHTPTITTDGDEIEFHLAPQGHKEGGLSDTVPVEWIFKPNTNYLIRLTNNNAQAIEALLEAFWYES